ncbi:hypothetical protein HY249_01950 [Candidatus Azambacteria bacterium]|nr:hypothetical protein [Candidatus Azambacteria bacterium]
MTDRQKSILFAVIQEYIKAAQPVSSKLIFEKYDFDISPATFRSEFAELEEMGCLFQPHTSSGRVPTDAGYRLFVNHILGKRETETNRMKSVFSELLKARRRQDEIFADLARSISELSQGVVFSGPLGAKMLFRSGINEVFAQPEFDDISFRRDFGSIVDTFEDNISSIVRKMDENQFLVFIGEENPFKRSNDFGMIVSKCNFSGSDSIVAILGPKRMNYEKNIELINSLIRLLK